ncbi:TPA: UMP kinase [Candidatus Saccharibacteria bacterium]|nr:UMP kinase [Candidatus Saccharibacteria bacterium]HIO87248.1 UMP kinase [Candidatus Saccharibacteria bacterium]
MSKTQYKRVLLKLSGEQFEGSRDHGIDPEFLNWLSQEIKQAKETGAEIIIVVGGGNMVRGAAFEKNGIERTAADYMGMLATLINGVAITNTLEANGMHARLMTRLRTESVAEPYIHRRAVRHLEKGRIVVIGGGTGNPYVTTDTASVQAAVELHCDAVLKATKVDGVYDKDPAQHDDAIKHDTLTHSQALKSDTIRVMDKPALAMATDNNLPIVVFDLLREGNIKRVIEGESVGTVIAGS